MAYDVRNGCSYLCLNNAIARIETDSSSLYKSRVRRSLWISGMRVIDEFSGKRKTLVVQPGAKVEPEFNTVNFTLCYPVYSNYTYKVRYRLEGYSDQWVPGGRYLQKKYSRLSYGSYVFQVEIYDTDRVLASVELPLRFCVRGICLIGLWEVISWQDCVCWLCCNIWSTVS